MLVAVAKDLLHMKAWLDLVSQIAVKGESTYLADPILQEAGDALMAKVGEAANRLSRSEVSAPDGVRWASAVSNRNFIIHQYDEVDRPLTWVTLSRDLMTWKELLDPLFADAERAVST